MPLIPYPDVPPLPGVPAINRNSAGYVAAALTVLGEFLPNSLFGTKWAIIDQNGSISLTPDSFVSFEYKNERRIPNYPIEDGSFQSYNKVALPFDCRLVVSCSGNGQMSKGEFLETIQNMLDSLDLFTISTPNYDYKNCNLVHVDYRRESRQGATLILAQLWFQEVRIAQQPSPPTAQPSGAATSSFGQLSPVSPTGTFGSFNANSTGGIGIK
jgi:hypothetical protein